MHKKKALLSIFFSLLGVALFLLVSAVPVKATPTTG